MKRLLALALLLLIASPAFASTQVFTGSATSFITNSIDFNVLNSNASSQAAGIVAAPGILSSMKIYLGTSPGSGSWTPTLYKNGSPTAITCATMTGSTVTCTDLTHTVSIAVGDYFYVQLTAASSPTVTAEYATLLFTPTTANQTLILSGGTITANTGTKYTQSYGGISNATEGNSQSIFPEAGTLNNFYVALTGSIGGSALMTYTVRKNLVSDLTMTTTTTDPATTNNVTSVSTTTDNSSLFDTQATLTSGTGSATTGGFGSYWVPNTAGDYPLIGSASGSQNTGATNYSACMGNVSVTQTEATAALKMEPSTVTLLSAHVRTAPGAAKSWIVTLDKNSAPTSLTCTMTGTGAANQICNASGSITFAAGDTCDVSWAPSGTPAATTMVQNALAAQYIPPPSGGHGIAVVLGSILTVIKSILTTY